VETEEEEFPPEPSESGPPIAGERHGDFVIQAVKGRGDGYRELILNDLDEWEPVVPWLDREHPSLDGGQVAEMLILMGLPGDRAAHIGINRDKRFIADAYILSHPAVVELQHQEDLHNQTKESFSRAFLERQKREGKK
jgi:hypothetical protein